MQKWFNKIVAYFVISIVTINYLLSFYLRIDNKKSEKLKLNWWWLHEKESILQKIC